MGDRIKYLDIAKGIGMFLVVWAHTNAPLTDYIEQFHMPFFFFVSGILFCPEKYTNKQYVKQKCKSLLLPFWGWNIIMFPVFFILYYWKEWNISTFTIGIVEILLTVNKVPFLGATWFLASLFWISVVVQWLTGLLKRNKYEDIILLFIGLCLCIVGFEITLPYKQSRTLICSLFYICGFLYNKHVKEIESEEKWNIISLLGLVIFIFIVQFNDCSMGENYYKYKILFIIGSFGAIIFVLHFAKWIAKQKDNLIVSHFIYFGKNSLDILIWHFLAFRIAIIVQMILYGKGMHVLTAFPVYDSSNGWWIMYVISGIYGSLIWKYILEHNYFTKLLKKFCLVR